MFLTKYNCTRCSKLQSRIEDASVDSMLTFARVLWNPMTEFIPLVNLSLTIGNGSAACNEMSTILETAPPCLVSQEMSHVRKIEFGQKRSLFKG